MEKTRSMGVAAGKGLATLVTLAVIPCVLACATPEGVRKKSAASQNLYADLDRAYGAYVRATGTFLEDRDRLASAVKIAAGQAPPAFAAEVVENAETTRVLEALSAVGAAIGIARIQYGVVDRFLQIDVFDEAEAAKVSSKLNSALQPAQE